MKLYVISKKESEYNDNYDELRDGGFPIKAFKSHDNALQECNRMNKEERLDIQTEGYQEHDDHYFVTSVDVQDQDLVSYSDKLVAAKAAKAEASKLAKEYLHDQLKDLFDNNESLVAVRWPQYTPYFNDGDECRFRVSDVRCKFSDTKDDSGEYEDGFYDSWEVEDETKEGIIRKANSIIESADRDDLKQAFDDHVQVTATRDGFEVEEYEHD